jgi:hypothetical protein
LQVQILRDGRLQHERSVLLSRDASLCLRATREGDRLVFQVNDLPALEFQDVFPLGTPRPGVFALEWPEGVGLRSLRAEHRPPPLVPSLLEQGDELYARGNFAAARDRYAEQARGPGHEAATEEARYKLALCLLALNQAGEAASLLEQLAQGVTEDRRDRWSLLAACQLWLHYLKEQQYDDAENVFRLLGTHYRFEQLAALVSDELRQQILEGYRSAEAGLLFIRHNPRQEQNLRRVLAVQDLFQAPVADRARTAIQLIQRCLLNEQADEAAHAAEEMLKAPNLPPGATVQLVWGLACALRQRGGSDRALAELDRYVKELAGRSPPNHLPLLLERTRLHAARREWEAAERDSTTYFQQLNSGQWASGHVLLAQGHMVRGFLREQRGDAAGALEDWRQGLGLLKGNAGLVSEDGFILASLADDLSEADAAFVVEQTTARLVLPAALFVRKGGSFDLAFVAAVLRGAWRNDRGRAYARRIAFHDLPYMDLHGIQFALFIAEGFRQGALIGPASPDQEAVVWQASEGVYRAYTHGGFTDAQAFFGLTAWTGVAGFSGWASLSSSLGKRPDLRGPLAYLYGQRFLRLKKPADARKLFETALTDAPAGTPLSRLARAALDAKSATK